MHGIFKTYTKHYSLNTQKTRAFTDSVRVKKQLYYSNISYLFTFALWKGVDLSPPGNLNGGGVKFHCQFEDPMVLQSFTDKLFLMLIIC